MSYKPNIVIRPTRLQAAAYDITTTGEVTFPTGKPAGSILVKAVNFDRTVEAATALTKSNPSLANMGVYVTLAAALGKKQPDGSTVWDIRFDDASVSVNGQKLQ